MIDWFALSNELPEHPKTHKLARALKVEEAGWYVVRLFAWCSKHNHKGTFAEADAEAEVELAAGWHKKPGAFFDAALAAGFLERRDDGFVEVHDWWNWNGRNISAAEAEAERKRAKRLEEQPNGKGSAADRRLRGGRTAVAARLPVGGSATPDADADADSVSAIAETPPVVPRDGSDAALPLGLPDLDAEVYQHWRSNYAPRAAPVLTEKRRKLIRSRRAERPPATAQQDLLDSLSGWKHDSWSGRREQTDLEILLRDAGQVDKGLKLLGQGPGIHLRRDGSGGAEQFPPEAHTTEIKLA